MNYANTTLIDGLETVAVVLPLDLVPQFDPDNPPQPNTYGVPDDVQVGWVRNGARFIPPPDDLVRKRDEIKARSERDRRLAASDWTQLPDVAIANRQAWAVYRQSLRDVTLQANFPTDIIWPAPPA